MTFLTEVLSPLPPAPKPCWPMKGGWCTLLRAAAAMTGRGIQWRGRTQNVCHCPPWGECCPKPTPYCSLPHSFPNLKQIPHKKPFKLEHGPQETATFAASSSCRYLNPIWQPKPHTTQPDMAVLSTRLPLPGMASLYNSQHTAQPFPSCHSPAVVFPTQIPGIAWAWDPAATWQQLWAASLQPVLWASMAGQHREKVKRQSQQTENVAA